MWDGRTFFSKLDALSPFPVFERLYDTYRTSRAFPDYAATLTNLGLRMNFGRIRTDDGAALVDVRRAIMRPHPRLTVGPSAAPICDETPR